MRYLMRKTEFEINSIERFCLKNVRSPQKSLVTWAIELKHVLTSEFLCSVAKEC